MKMATSSAAAFEGAEQDDAEIIRQVLQGNTGMFELLMRRYNERVYRAARAIVRDEHETEDVMQQAYVNAFTQLRQCSFSRWRSPFPDRFPRLTQSRLPPRPNGSVP